MRRVDRARPALGTRKSDLGVNEKSVTSVLSSGTTIVAVIANSAHIGLRDTAPNRGLVRALL